VVRCPLPDHEDRTPSCSMTQRDGVWLVCCHGCGFSGDGVDLLATLDGMSTSQWLRLRAQRAAPLPVPHRRPPRPESVFRSLCTPAELVSWLDACHAALLDGPASAAARRYARRRGLTPEEVRGWRIGYAIPTRLPKLGRMAGRLVLPCPGGVEARAIDDTTPKYLSANLLVDRKLPFALDQVTPARGPLVLVEGIFDALALHRVEVQAIALRGKPLAVEAAQRLRALGFTAGYISLDADAAPAAVLAVGRTLHRAGLTPYWARGPQGVNDWGELLTRPPEELLAVVAEGLVLR
jgi:DNA primase